MVVAVTLGSLSTFGNVYMHRWLYANYRACGKRRGTIRCTHYWRTKPTMSLCAL